MAVNCNATATMRRIRLCTKCHTLSTAYQLDHSLFATAWHGIAGHSPTLLYLLHSSTISDDTPSVKYLLPANRHATLDWFSKTWDSLPQPPYSHSIPTISLASSLSLSIYSSSGLSLMARIFPFRLLWRFLLHWQHKRGNNLPKFVILADHFSSCCEYILVFFLNSMATSTSQ